jgi:hypothetical protein
MDDRIDDSGAVTAMFVDIYHCLSDQVNAAEE